MRLLVNDLLPIRDGGEEYRNRAIRPRPLMVALVNISYANSKHETLTLLPVLEKKNKLKF